MVHLKISPWIPEDSLWKSSWFQLPFVTLWGCKNAHTKHSILSRKNKPMLHCPPHQKPCTPNICFWAKYNNSPTALCSETTNLENPEREGEFPYYLLGWHPVNNLGRNLYLTKKTKHCKKKNTRPVIFEDSGGFQIKLHI